MMDRDRSPLCVIQSGRYKYCDCTEDWLRAVAERPWLRASRSPSAHFRIERRAAALRLRAQGLTFEQIGDTFGVTGAAARKSVVSGKADAAAYALFVFRELHL